MKLVDMKDTDWAKMKEMVAGLIRVEYGSYNMHRKKAEVQRWSWAGEASCFWNVVLYIYIYIYMTCSTENTNSNWKGLTEHEISDYGK